MVADLPGEQRVGQVPLGAEGAVAERTLGPRARPSRAPHYGRQHAGACRHRVRLAALQIWEGKVKQKVKRHMNEKEKENENKTAGTDNTLK
jgi:hypothetical protein